MFPGEAQLKEAHRYILGDGQCGGLHLARDEWQGGDVCKGDQVAPKS